MNEMKKFIERDTLLILILINDLINLINSNRTMGILKKC